MIPIRYFGIHTNIKILYIYQEFAVYPMFLQNMQNNNICIKLCVSVS